MRKLAYAMITLMCLQGPVSSVYAGDRAFLGYILLISPFALVNEKIDSLKYKLTSKRQKRLIERGDAEASAVCVLNCENMRHLYGDETYSALSVLSSRNVTQAWASAVRPEQLITVMKAYEILGDAEARDDMQQARLMWLKSLSYLQDESVRDLDGFRYYEVDGKTYQERAILFAVLNPIARLSSMDFERRVCIFDERIFTYLNDKFPADSIKEALDWSCSVRIGIEKDRFFSGELKSKAAAEFFLNPHG